MVGGGVVGISVRKKGTGRGERRGVVQSLRERRERERGVADSGCTAGTVCRVSGPGAEGRDLADGGWPWGRNRKVAEVSCGGEWKMPG